VGGSTQEKATDWEVVEAALVEALMAGQDSLSNITKAVAKAHHRPRTEVYARALQLQQKTK
jgi:hypothetical protein